MGRSNGASGKVSGISEPRNVSGLCLSEEDIIYGDSSSPERETLAIVARQFRECISQSFGLAAHLKSTA
jgi:hypothetical protein